MGYIITNIYGFKEEDNYKEGCLPETAFNIDLNMSFKAKTQEELRQKLCDYFGVKKDCVDLNACGENGRIDIQVLENEESLSITEEDKQTLKLWKEGKTKLWLATYTGFLQEIKLKKWDVKK